MTSHSIKYLKKLIWEKYFRHYGIETTVWSNKQCISLSERLKKTGYSQAPSPRTLYNFSKFEKASDYTLSTLVHAVYSDNKEFEEYFNNEYQGNDNLKWEAFADFTSRQFDLKNNKRAVNASNQNNQCRNNSDLNDPLLFIYKLAGGKIPLVFAFYFLIFSVVIILLAISSGVWNNIDYPLSQSYTVWIGYVFFAAAATFFTLFNKQLALLLTYTNSNAISLIKSLSSSKVKLILLIPAIVIAGVLHYIFLADTIHGWCESQPGKLSFLGFYHVILYIFSLWLLFIFVFYYVNLGKIIRMIAETVTKNNDGDCQNLNSVIPILSRLNIYYKLIIIAFGGFAILFFITTILLIKNNNSYTLLAWQWVEIGILVIMYVGFGFILYWRYFAKNISNFLIAQRNKLLLRNSADQQEMVYALTLPTSPDETNKHAANILNILIWIISMCLILLIGTLLYIIN